MGSKPRISSPATSTKRVRRKSSNSSTRLRKPETRHRRAGDVDGGAAASVSDKLEALKNLVPSENNVEIKPDQLFQETADYIVLLKTQVLVLQKLIDFYGSQPQENMNDV